MIELSESTPIFVGLRLETSLRRQLENLEGPEKKYVSPDDSTFLRICKAGSAYYVGKLIEEPLTTARIDDIERNVVSILQRLLPDERLPKQFEIFAAPVETPAPTGSASGSGARTEGEGGSRGW